MSKKRKVIKIVIIASMVLILLAIINFVPTWNLKVSGMSELHGTWIDLYYEEEEAAARDVFVYADSETAAIAEKLGFREKQNVDVYVYDFQSTMQTKKYGFVAPLLGLDWYIGDNIGTNVILTSPANPGDMHDYDNNKYAVLHEIAHAYVSVKNKDIDLWLTEGVALYLSNGQPFYKKYIDSFGIPAYEDVCSNNPIRFSNCGGYTFAHTYIEYLDCEYGWDRVLKLIETGDYEACFEASSKEVYNAWTKFIENYYQ